MTAGVYAIINTATGHRYIGSTKNFRVRSGSHRWSIATGNFFNKALCAAWAEYGPGVFQIELLEETASDDDTLESAERHWIQHFAKDNRAALYNWHLTGRRHTRPARPCACQNCRRASTGPGLEG
jgi:group I intron endonuclease